MKYERIEVQPIAGAMGAEIKGVDLSQLQEEQTISEIHQAFLEHLMIFFRDQTLTPAQQVTFARYFGEPNEYPFVKGLEEQPEIIPVIKLEHETVNFGGVWHSDTVYLETPPMGTILYAKELPPVGGDTLFANMYLAYETLSAGMKKTLAGLTAVHRSDKLEAAQTRDKRIKTDGKETGGVKTISAHPAVRTHPETGKKALYVNIAHTVQFKEMTKAESEPILNYLFQHQIRPEFTCRLVWTAGTLTFWDNRATQHNPINDYHGYRRVMHRISLEGQPPV